MSMEVLAAHIAQCDEMVEKYKQKSAIARSVKKDRELKMTDEERKILKKVRVEMPVETIKPPKMNPKNNPVGYTMKTYGVNRATAEAMLGLKSSSVSAEQLAQIIAAGLKVD